MTFEEACDLAVQEAGGNALTAVALLRDYANRNETLRAELLEKAIDHMMSETIDEAINDGFSLSDVRLASEVGARLSKASSPRRALDR
jgi:hypothetical protein